jgi:hypothetical protein
MRISPLDFLDDPNLLGPFFEGSSWDRWRAVLRAAFALPMSKQDKRLFHEVAGDRSLPKHPVRELVCVVGRGGGKDAIASAVMTYLAVVSDFSRLRPGERGTIMLIANDKDQASIALNYIRGYFERVPLLASLVDKSKDDYIDLKNGATITVVTNNYRSPRGRTIVAAGYDECAFYRSEESSNPDFEVDAAIAPGLARWPGSMKILISSAYRRTGLLYERWKTAFGQDNPDTLAVLGTSLQFNPTLDPSIIGRELEKDKERAQAEYCSIWRDDLSNYISRQIVEQLIDVGVTEWPPEPGHTYIGFTDEAGGSGSDASTLAIVHVDRDKRIIQDLIKVWKPPFSPQAVIAEKAAICRRYRISKLVGDRYAGGIPPDLYRNHSIHFEQSAKSKSDIYLDFLNVLNSSRIRLLDNEQQITELLNLERRVRWGGKESIDHPQNGNYHDDAINAVAGAAVLAATKRFVMHIDPEVLARSTMAHPPIHTRMHYYNRVPEVCDEAYDNYRKMYPWRRNK